MNIFQYIGSAVELLLDAIMPPRSRSVRTTERVAADIPLEPTVHELLGTRITTLMNYRRAEVQDLIRSLKYDASAYGAKLAADLLADYLREEIDELKTFSTKPIILVPVPLYKARQRERGYNQIELVLSALPNEFRNGDLASLSRRLLQRMRATPPQTKLSRRERLKNVENAFDISDPEIAKSSHIFLIDDVTTTGATLLEASKPLKKAGAEVTLLALARA